MSDDQTEQHLALMLQIAAASTETGDLQYFSLRCLELIAKTYDWTIGQIWHVDQDADVITCSSVFYSKISATEFRKSSQERRFSPGVGLPGRIWALGSALSILDLESQSGLSFPRGDVARQFGLKSAFGFPIRNGTIVSSVYEFFSQEERSVDDKNSRFFEKLGAYLGTLMAEKAGQQKLYESELINSAILDRAKNGFVSIDSRGIILSWNQQAQTIFGWTKAEMIGQLLVEKIIPVRYRNAHINGMFRHLATGATTVVDRTVQTPALHKNGHEIPIELSIFAIDVLDKKHFGAFMRDLQQVDKPPDIVLT